MRAAWFCYRALSARKKVCWGMESILHSQLISYMKGRKRNASEGSPCSAREEHGSRPAPRRPQNRCGKCTKTPCRDAEVHPNSVLLHTLPDPPRPGLLLTIRFDLSRNYIGDKGLGPVLQVIQRCPQLKRVILRDNGLRNNAVKQLAATAAKHQGLTSIDVSNNYVSEGAAKALAQLLETHKRIVDIGIAGTKFEADARVRIRMRRPPMQEKRRLPLILLSESSGVC